MHAEVLTSFLTSGAARGIGGALTLLASGAAIYNFFIEFVQSDEQAVRAHNNRPDLRHEPLGRGRRIIYLVEGIAAVAVIALGIWSPLGLWCTLGLLAGDGVAVIITTLTWPQTDEIALVGRGIKFKIPGWISYKRGVIAQTKHEINQEGITDASGELVNITVVYYWGRTRDDGAAMWRSLVEIANLNEVMDFTVKVAVQMAVSQTSNVNKMSSAQMSVLSEMIFDACSATFAEEFGVTLKSVRIAGVGMPPLVAVAKAIRESGAISPVVAAVISDEV